jgi:hypothetical protein
MLQPLALGRGVAKVVWMGFRLDMHLGVAYRRGIVLSNVFE